MINQKLTFMKKITFLSFLFSFVFAAQANAQLNEGFDTAGLPTGWTETASSTFNWEIGATANNNSTVSPRSGAGMALFYAGTYSGPTSRLETPSQDLTSLTSPMLTFYYTQVDWSGDQDELSVYYKDSATGTWTLISSYTSSVSSWTKVELSLPNPSADYYIGFEGLSGYGHGITLDDVSIGEAPSCPPPSALSAASITATSAEISWTSDDSSFNIEVVDVTAGGTATGTATETGVTSPYSLSGLSSNNEYEVYVQTDCGPGETSDWASLSFTTNPSCGDTVSFCYDNGLNSVFSTSVDNAGDYIAVSISGYTEASYDDLIIYDTADQSGNILYNTNGDHTGQSVTSTTGVISVWVDADTSVSCQSPSSFSGLPDGPLSFDIACYPPPPSWAGDWKISPESGSLAVGNAANTSQIWWQSAALTHTERACLYDDIYSFGADGSFQNILGTETWLEGWQGTSPDACGTPVAPHDGSVAATYSYDETAGTVTINGVGAYLGLPKAYNGGELANPADAPSSITYTIESVDSDFMTLYIDVGGNFWRFKLIRADLDILTDVTFSVNTANITVGANGMYLGGGVIGGANAVALSDADSDGTWEATVSLAQGTTGNYVFLNSPNDGGDWGAKENLGGQECADANNYNDRILAAVGSDDYTLMHCFGSCETDGSCPAPLLDPEVCAPVATHLEADVISVYSDAYSANIYTDLNPNWWQATVASEIQIGPDNDCNVLKYESLNYQGLLYQQTDVTTMDYVHLDYYTDNSTAIGFYVIQSGTGENGYFIHDELGITTGEWVSIDIPLSHYTGTDLSGANEIKTDGNGTVYLDNIYFWRDSTASIDDNDTSEFSYYPNPVNDALTIKAQKVVEDIKVLNILGQVVKQQTPNTMDCTVDLSAMQSGAYFVQVSIGNTVETVRVLKK